MSTACLLLHGFAGSPFEIASLAPGLRALGCTVEVPTLPGHGTSIADFRTTFFKDWFGHAEQRFLALNSIYTKVIVMGFSMGGGLALHLAAKYDMAGLVTLAAPLWAYRSWFGQRGDPRISLTPLLRHIRPELPMPHAKEASRAVAPFEGYEGVLCLPQLYSLQQGLLPLRKLLPRIACPTLLMHDARDKYVPSEVALIIAREISSPDVVLHYTHIQENITSHHMIATHQETRDLVIQKVTDFVKRIMAE